MPDNPNLDELQREEYELRQELGRIERALTSATADDLDELLSRRIAVQERLNTVMAMIQTATPPATGVITRSARKSETGVDIRVGMDYVPTSVYHLVDPAESALVIATVDKKSAAARSAPATVSITSYIEGYSARKVDVVTREMVKSTEVRQSPTLLPDRVKTITELTPATLHVEVHDFTSGTKIDHITRTVWLLARNSVTTAVRDPDTGAVTDLSRYLGAYVTPNAPAVMHFLRKVADYHPQHKLAGYQPGAPVEDQVRAVFDALKNETKVVYVNSLVDFNPQEGSQSQRIRLPREALDERQANCVDGTVLVASLLEAISLTPAIVLVPKHAFVGWQVDKDEKSAWNYLETTLIDSGDFQQAVDYATRLAATYEKQANTTGNPAWFRRLSLRDLRTTQRIWPME